MNYSKLVSKAWAITWRYKFLWVFGTILALFSGENGPSFNYTFGGGSGETPRWLTDFLSRLGNIEPQTILSVILASVGVLLLIGLLATLLSLVVTALSRGALVAAVDAIERQETTGLRQAASAGSGKLFSLIGIDIILNWTLGLLIFFVVAGVVVWMVWPVLPLALQAARGEGTEAITAILIGTVLSGIALLACFVLLIIPIVILVSLLFVLAINVCIVESAGVFRSITRSWQLFWRNLGSVLLIWLINVVIFMVFGIIVGLPAALIFFALFLVAAASNFATGVIGFVIAIGLLFGVLVLVLAGVGRAYSSVLWTLTYLEIMKRGQAIDVNPT